MNMKMRTSKMNTTHLKQLIAATLASLMVASAAHAADTTPPSGKPPGPPPEAVAACKGRTAGTTVSFTGRNGETMTGVCTLIDGVLAARPSGGPPGAGGPSGAGGPPPAK